MSSHPTAVEPVESPELLARNLWVGARLWAAAQAFFFLAFLFAFFYLRALNSNDIWRGWPKHTHFHPSYAFGIAILVCVVVSAALLKVPGITASPRWRFAGLVSLGLGLAAVGLQVVQFSSLGFGPTDGGYASVFVGWTGLYALSVLGTMYWLTTVIAGSFRHPGAPGVVQAAAAEAVAFVWVVLAVIEVVAFILLYVVA
jgi:heme/copper-type cytochrome/quinol oxidase subunit 3